MSAEPDGEARMSLYEHLTELRSRLLRATLAVLGLAVAALVFAKPIFAVLMKPVLAALPADNRALIYTSGIEEINVLMKVGLYAGIFLGTPVILWQIWSFIAPGLYPTERRMAGPFVFFGSLSFLTGACFCYFVLLPTMFQFLLREGDSAALEHRLDRARQLEDDSLRYLRLGDFDKAGALAQSGATELGATGDGHATSAALVPDTGVELVARAEGLGRLIDATAGGVGSGARAVLIQVVNKRREAADAIDSGNLIQAARVLDEAASLLPAAVPARAAELAALWKLQKDVAAGKARYAAQTWTRPMLTMREQLSLVLLLLLAFGVIFELPVIMAVLGLVGLVTSKFLFRYQRHALVFCLIAAAIVTPTSDAVNLALMAGPMFLCFELGVLAVWLIERRRPAAGIAIAPQGE